MDLVIVESPAKAKTIGKYLGKDFLVLASYGQVRDLIPKKGSVLPEDNFAMHYELIAKNAQNVKAILAAAKKAKALYLATDADREGEAISWHLLELLKEKKSLPKLSLVHRIVFHEITKNAIQHAIDHPRSISDTLVQAQQARRAIDYLVGFHLSPVLWKKISAGLSAGRVQSPALRLIVEREESIEQFCPQEYWSVMAELRLEDSKLLAKLIVYCDEKLTQFSIATESAAVEAKKKLELATAGNSLVVLKVSSKQRKRYPVAPFITATLQKEAAHKLGFSAKKTMMVAQQLYEGIELADGAVGLITYMRTDSTNLSIEAVEDIRRFILEFYGPASLPAQAITYKTKSKNAQEAHEAIRPTSIFHRPQDIEKFLTKEQFALYALIWQRSLACQMVPAILNSIVADLTCPHKPDFGAHVFRVSASTISNPGFMAVYKLTDDDDVNGSSLAVSNILSALKVGDSINFDGFKLEQHFTEPLPRYSEATLVKTLEELGIGRPATYAVIISTLLDREYVYLEQKRFKPTDIGRLVNKFLVQYFSDYVDYEFTAQLENKLDSIACGQLQMLPVLQGFWAPFHELLTNIQNSVKRESVVQVAIGENCPQCSHALVKKLGKNGYFIACSAYPDCAYTRSLQQKSSDPISLEQLCPQCNSNLQEREGRYGKFVGCSAYPQCNYIVKKNFDTGVKCPSCGQGSLQQKRSRKGKMFFACSAYPTCKYALWDQPYNIKCPRCSWPILIGKAGGKTGKTMKCPQDSCDFSCNEHDLDSFESI